VLLFVAPHGRRSRARPLKGRGSTSWKLLEKCRRNLAASAGPGYGSTKEEQPLHECAVGPRAEDGERGASMEILPYEPSVAQELATTYNHAVQWVPHCYPAGDEEFARALASTLGEGEANQRLHSEAAFVAWEGSTIVGFVHTAVGPLEEGEVERGSIRFLWYERGHRAAGQALLEAAESNLRDQGMSRIEAMRNGDTYGFYHVRCAHL
jgi:hypothetical protein